MRFRADDGSEPAVRSALSPGIKCQGRLRPEDRVLRRRCFPRSAGRDVVAEDRVLFAEVELPVEIYGWAQLGKASLSANLSVLTSLKPAGSDFTSARIPSLNRR